MKSGCVIQKGLYICTQITTTKLLSQKLIKMKNLSRFNANRKASNQGMKQVLINNVNAGIANGTIEKLKPFTTPDGFLYTNPAKGNLLFVVSQNGTFYSVAKYVSK